MAEIIQAVIDKKFIINNFHVLSQLSQQIEDDYWTLENYLYELPNKWQLSEACLLGNSEIVGFVIASLKNNCTHIHRIVVSPKNQGQGIGSLLIASLIVKAKKYNINCISLKVSVENKKAFSYYLKKGFVNNGIVQNIADPDNNSYQLTLMI